MKAKEMVKLLEDFLSSTTPGVRQITVDGQTVSYDRDSALKELDHWRKKAAKESGTRSLFRGFDIDSAW